MKRLMVLFAIPFLLQGCAYAVSRDMVSRADRTLTFEMLQADPDSFKGKLLILGGTIAHIVNTKQGAMIEVAQKPLDYWGKPKRTDATGGRFLVLYPGYLDALVYEPGRDLTVAAEVEGTRSKALGEAEYLYPVVAAKELRLWERERQSWDRPQWIDPLYDPFSTGGRGW